MSRPFPTHSVSGLDVMELRFLRKPEKMESTLRLFFLRMDGLLWRDESWLKRTRERERAIETWGT